jgi:hypothetical protein
VLELAFIVTFIFMIIDRAGSVWFLMEKARLSAWEVWANIWELYDWCVSLTRFLSRHHARAHRHGRQLLHVTPMVAG